MSAPLRCQRPNGLTKRISKSQAKARQAARSSTGALGRKMRAYRCPWCGWWHLSGAPDRFPKGDER